MENGKYKRDGIMWMERKSSLPLTGLVYDFAENGKRIDFGMFSDCFSIENHILCANAVFNISFDVALVHIQI